MAQHNNIRQTDVNEWLSFERPARYMGGEWNQVVKEEGVRCRMLLAFPNTYEIGMSHLGMRILYDLINKRGGLAAERAYCPWPDVEERMAAEGKPLRSLETGRGGGSFDLIGFSLQSELDYTNVLTMLHLSGLPLRAAEREIDLPLVIAGGPVAFNPEPIAPFLDLFLLGDAEECLPELMLRLAEMKDGGADKDTILRELSRLQGVYAPALYDTRIDEHSGLEVVIPPEGCGYPFLKKALVEDLDKYPFPKQILTPNCDIVHDRASVEIIRGCSRGCRFCQAGVIYMPERQRSPQSVADSIIGMLRSTGYRDVSLTALTPNDYEALTPLVSALMERFRAEGVSLSLASLSPEHLDETLLELIRQVRKTGLTIAPEAGSQRMRDVINKNITEEHVLTTAATAFGAGWRLIKLYFMIGLPTETDDDVRAIGELAKKVLRLRKGAKVRVGCSSFIPKSHTPFQWVAMERPEALKHKQRLLRESIKETSIQLSTPDVRDSILEGVFSRGDRRVARALERAWRLGCRYDGWGDHLRFDLWLRAFEETGVDPEFYNHRTAPPFAAMPWSHIDTGVRVDFLREEYQRALAGVTNIRCAPKNCPRCRACPPELLKARWREGLIHNNEIAPVEKPAIDMEQQTRYRFRFSKSGALLSLGHLDLAQLVARSFRRAGIAVAMSQGFHPLPRIQFALALPLGQEGRNEYFDAVLCGEHDADELAAHLNEVSPEGLTITAARPVSSSGALSAELAAADYRVKRADGGRFSRESLDRFLAREKQVWRRRHKGKIKEFDIREQVLGVENVNSWGELRLRLRIGEGLNAKAAEVIEAAFGVSPDRISIIREQLYIDREGRLTPPV